MTGKQKGDAAGAEKSKRLNKALRDNLARRKAQARARADGAERKPPKDKNA